MKAFAKLSDTEQQEFLKFPVYISLLAANEYGPTDDVDIKAAVEFDHMKTYTCVPLLSGFYAKADELFKNNFIKLDAELPKGKAARTEAIKTKLAELEILLLKFDKDYAAAMHQSMKSFKEHVSSAHWDILDSFLFPVPIKGISY
ncbi:hypothetical protein [Mucilaginibacter sp. UYCu711]|jgi:hypothetical protein|uniref:hypothetical protein n=1 Tax=Mucilaginibacter sp. UYCu711 TaxID=3156339 RepID=UPI003D237832